MFIKSPIASSQRPFNDIKPTLDNLKLQRLMIQATSQLDLTTGLETLRIANQKGYADSMEQLADGMKG
jgi:hypothetical protein